MRRCDENPILTPADVKPSRDGYTVVGIFNCGVAKYGNETILLCRVAEGVREQNPSVLKVPVIGKDEEGNAKFDTLSFSKTDPHYDFGDPRTVYRVDTKDRQVVALTSLSHLRVARSRDGIHFTVSETPVLMPDPDYESWGMEDPRVTQIGEDYFITYSAVAPFGVSTALLQTRDFREFQRLGVIFAPENKDVTIFPEKLNGNFFAFNRPVPQGIGQPNMWLAESPDLIHWGRQRLFRTVSRQNAWDSGRIGGGAVPIATPRGWLKIYHAADRGDRYCLGALLLKREDPSVILGQLEKPLLEPEADYEKNGFFGNVVFTCGALIEGDTLRIYYGAADDKICLAETSLSALLDRLGKS